MCIFAELSTDMIKDLISRFKPAYSLYNYLHKDQLIHLRDKYKVLGLKKKWYSSVSSADFTGLPKQDLWLDKNPSQTALPGNTAYTDMDRQTQQALINWSDNGYAILEGFFNKEADAAWNEVTSLLDAGTVNWKYGNKIMFAAKHSKLLRDMGNNPELIKVLNLLMGKDVRLFQSINFESGSEQGTHSDSVHMSTYPLGNLIAVWVALEDIDEQCGPLHYYPGSHKMLYLLNDAYDHGGSSLWIGDDAYLNYEQAIQAEIEKNDLSKQVFTAKKGDVLIWHANLLHGGEPVLSKDSTRKSMVFHYFVDDAICYHELTQRPALMQDLS